MPIQTRMLRFAARTVSVEALLERIDDLSRERQALRAERASAAALEENRLAIVEAQWDLSRALVKRYLPAA
jgi:hypothetical protein